MDLSDNHLDRVPRKVEDVVLEERHEVEGLEPAQHDEPDGPSRGWSAADFGPEDYVDDTKVDRSTRTVARGDQKGLDH